MSSKASISESEEKMMMTRNKKLWAPLPPVPRLPLEVEAMFDGHTFSKYPPILQINSWTKAKPFKVIMFTLITLLLIDITIEIKTNDDLAYSACAWAT